VIDINYQNQSLVIARPKNDGQNFYALPLTNERWADFERENKVGDVIQVQAKAWLSDKSRLLVASKHGIAGLINKKEIIWTNDTSSPTSNIDIDDLFDAKIIKINSIKHKIELSIRELIPNPLSEINMDNMLNKPLNGIITSVKDYGYFVHIPLLKCTGLLHISKLNGVERTFKKNDSISVLIDHLDLEKNRVSLKL
jgi:ribosomal protein S1